MTIKIKLMKVPWILTSDVVTESKVHGHHGDGPHLLSIIL